MDMGDCVVIINAEKIKLTGSKEKNKTYFSHSGYPGETSFVDVEEVRRTHPERILESAIKGMLPKNRLGRKMMTHLRIYAGSDHPHAAQNPTGLDK
jgi:large subunit ribosomal protein L13